MFRGSLIEVQGSVERVSDGLDEARLPRRRRAKARMSPVANRARLAQAPEATQTVAPGKSGDDGTASPVLTTLGAVADSGVLDVLAQYFKCQPFLLGA